MPSDFEDQGGGYALGFGETAAGVRKPLRVDDDGNLQIEDSATESALGATTDAAASSTVPEDAAARTGIGLWKGIKNILILIRAALPAALAAGGGLKVEGVASGVAQPISDAVEGSTTDAPADVVEDGTARTGVSVWKGIKNYLKTLASAISGGKMLVTADAITGAVTVSGTATVTQGSAGELPWKVTEQEAFIAGHERITNDASSKTLTVPPTAKKALIVAEAGDVRYAPTGVADATSPGYVPGGMGVKIPPPAAVYGAVGTFANVVYLA